MSKKSDERDLQKAARDAELRLLDEQEAALQAKEDSLRQDAAQQEADPSEEPIEQDPAVTAAYQREIDGIFEDMAASVKVYREHGRLGNEGGV